MTRPFREELPALQLGFSAMDSNDSKALSIFRRVVLDCAATAFSRSAAPSPLVVFPARVDLGVRGGDDAAPSPVVVFPHSAKRVKSAVGTDPSPINYLLRTAITSTSRSAQGAASAATCIAFARVYSADRLFQRTLYNLLANRQSTTCRP